MTRGDGCPADSAEVGSAGSGRAAPRPDVMAASGVAAEQEQQPQIRGSTVWIRPSHRARVDPSGVRREGAQVSALRFLRSVDWGLCAAFVIVASSAVHHFGWWDGTAATSAALLLFDAIKRRR